MAKSKPIPTKSEDMRFAPIHLTLPQEMINWLDAETTRRLLPSRSALILEIVRAAMLAPTVEK